jgi:hypothetical protein
MEKGSMQDRSTFDGNRFGRKVGIWFGIFIGTFLGLCLLAEGASLGMNAFIYKGPFMRAVLGLWFGLAFLVSIPYYIFIGLTKPSDSPKRYALFPLHKGHYEWQIMNSFFGEGSYLPTTWEPDDNVLDRMGLLADPDPKDKYILPITLDTLNI